MRRQKNNLHSNRRSLSTIVAASLASIFLINLEGADPADFVTPILLITLLPKIRQSTTTLPARTKLLLLAFVGGYASSVISAGGQDSFIVNLILNATLLFCLITLGKCGTSLAELITYFFWPYLLLGAIATGMWLLDIQLLANQFDIVRHNRFMSLCGDPNILGAFSIFFVIVWLHESIKGNLFPKLPRVLVYGCLFGSVMQLLFTLSRSAWLGCALGVTFYLALGLKHFTSKQLRALALLGVILLGAALLLLQYSELSEVLMKRTETIKEQTDEAEEERFGFFYTLLAIGVAIDNPLGVGPGNTAAAMGLFTADGLQPGSHNSFVQIFSDNGWIAGTAFLVCILSMFIESTKRSLSANEAEAAVFRIFAGTLLGLITCGMFQDLIQWRLMWLAPALFFVAKAQLSSRT